MRLLIYATFVGIVLKTGNCSLNVKHCPLLSLPTYSISVTLSERVRIVKAFHLLVKQRIIIQLPIHDGSM